MTDELTIQGVNPQMQQVQKKNNTVPYTLGGAAVGATAGYFINNAVQSKANWEDLVKEVKDTTDFSSKAEPATWNSLKEKANEVAKLQEQLKNLPEKTLPDNAQEVTDLKAAKENYAKALEATKKTVEAESKKTGSITKFLKPSEAASAGAFAGEGFETKLNEYKNLYNTYDIAYKNAEKSSKNNKTLADFESAVNDYFKKMRKNTEHGKYDKNSVKDLAELIKNQGIVVEEITDFSDWKEKGFKNENAYKKAYSNEIKQKQIALAKEILGEEKEVTIKVGAKDKKVKVFTNAYGDMQSYTKRQTKLDNISKDLADKIKQRKAAKKLPLKNYTITSTGRVSVMKDVNNIKDLLSVKDYNALLNSGHLKKDQKGVVNTLRDLALRQENATTEFNQSTKEFFNTLSRTSELKDAAKKEIFEATRKERGSLIGYINKNDKLKALMPKKSAVTMTADEIEKAAIERLKGDNVSKLLESAENAYKTALEKNGTANTAAREAIEGQIKTATEALEKGAQELAGKLKTGGMNKYAAMAIGGVALALAGFGIASSKKA